MRVAALGFYHGTQDQFAVGINADTLVGAITLSDADGMFPGSVYKTAIHVAVDPTQTVVAGTQGTIKSKPFTYAGVSAIATVTCDSADNSAGFVLAATDGSRVFASSGERPFDQGTVICAA